MHNFRRNLALFALLLNGRRDDAVRLLKRERILPEDFFRFTEQHQLQMFLFSSLEDEFLRQLFPRHLLDRLAAFYMRQWERQQSLVKELDRLRRSLRADGQDLILLKGPYLAERFYGGIERRAFSDLDILIRRERLSEVDRILRACGYVRKSKLLISRALTTRFTHAFDYGAGNIILDLHWALSVHPSYRIDYEKVWRRKQNFALGGEPCFVLSDEYEVTSNLLSIFRDLERGVARLKPFVDLYYILRGVCRDIDWVPFFANRRSEKTFNVSASVMSTLFGLFRCEDVFPELSSALRRETEGRRASPFGSGEKFFVAPTGLVRSKLWTTRVYECGATYARAWWLISLPFRLRVYHPGRSRRRLIRMAVKLRHLYDGKRVKEELTSAR